MKFLLHYWCLLLLIPGTFFGQERYFKNYQVDDGLSHNTITSILQDQRGFLWFGTKDGLNRFDGYSFKVFQHTAKKPHSLGSNFIRSLHEFKNNIWVGTDNGLFKYDEKKERFDLVQGTENTPILDISNDNLGNLWFIAAGSLYRHNLLKTETTAIPFPEDGQTQWVTPGPHNIMIVSSATQLYTYSAEDFKAVQLPLSYQKTDALPFLITSVKLLQDDVLLLGTKYHGALSYNLATTAIKPVLQAENPLFVRDFALKENNLWIATESGIFIKDLETGNVQHLEKNYNDRFALSDNAIYALVVDRANAVWVGTYFGGINYYAASLTPFKKYLPKIGENSISGNAIREIQEDRLGQLWIGTEDAGLNLLHPKTGIFENFSPESHGLAHSNVHGILARGNELWVGTFEHGLDVFDIRTKTLLRHYSASSKKGDLHSDFILDIFESADKRLYLATSSGIFEYFEETDQFEPVSAFPQKYHYSYLQEDSNGTLWAGTYWDGLLYYNPQSGKKGILTHSRSDTTSISSNVVNAIFEDSRKNLWITTENGLNKFNPESQNFTRFTKEDGMPSNVSYSMLEDQEQHLWISTAGGLVNFDPDTKSIQTYTKANGLPSNQFNYSSAYKDQDGTLYFGSVYGLVRFNPQDFEPSSYTAPLLFTGLQINNAPVRINSASSPLKSAIGFTNSITLKPDQSSFALEFSALDFATPKSTEYAYKLDGLRDKWVNLGTNHQVNFNELPAGDYTLKVKAKDNAGTWNTEMLSMQITVLPPFYLSTWAYIVYFSLLITGIYVLLRYYHKTIKRKNSRMIALLQNEKEREIYQAKIEFFTNVAHEIRTPLTLIKSPLEKLLNKSVTCVDEIKSSLKIMDKNTSRLLKLVNELLDFRKTESNNLQLTFVEVNITAMLAQTQERFSHALLEKNLDVHFAEGEKSYYAFVDEEAVRKILSNLFHNAIKYAENQIILEIQQEDEKIEVCIKNDGPAIPKELAHRIFEPFFRIEGAKNQRGTGLGLPLARSLAKMHKGDLMLDLHDSDYTSFKLSLPVHQDREFSLYNEKNEEKPILKETEEHLIGTAAANTSILVVEDNRELLHFVSTELEESYTVFQAENGEEALKILKIQSVQLIISDIKMPIKNGYSLCKTVKNTLETSHIPVILLTAKKGLNAKIEGLESGADAYVAKPFNIRHLRTQVATLIENRRHIMEYYASTPLSHLNSVGHSQTDAHFIEQLDDAINTQLSNPDLNVDMLSDCLNMSRSTLYRKIKELADLTPNELITITRLKRAAELLQTKKYRIFEIAEIVGYKSQSSFGRSFQKQFKMTPSQYTQQKTMKDS